MNNKQVAINWRNQEGAKRVKNMFYEGRTIYSYGYHFPMGFLTNRQHNSAQIVLLNADTYSSSTQRHQSYVKQVCSNDAIVEAKTRLLSEAKAQLEHLGTLSEHVKSEIKSDIEARIRHIADIKDRARRLKYVHEMDILNLLKQLETLKTL